MTKRLTIIILLASQVLSAQQITNWKFSFGPAKEIPGYIKVDPARKYTPENTYGFDFGTIPFAIDRLEKNPLRSGFITGDKPFFFSIALPEGNYNVTITFGDMKESSQSTVRVESRRLLFEKVKTLPGKFTRLEATVNIRVPRIGETGEEVKRKPREMNKLDWDEKLTFEFSDRRPCICALEIERVPDAVTVFLAGNSTVVDQDDDPWASWGQMFPRFLTAGVAVSNHAESGLSLGSFLSSNRLKKVLNMMKPGDYLFIEFGHNDQKEKGQEDGAFKSYSERMRLFVKEFRNKGGIPVIVSPANRRSFGDDGKITNSLGDYPEAARQVAKELNVPFIDLNAMTKTLYESLGPERSKNLFVIYPANTFPDQKEALNDNTHFNSYGAYQLAKCVIEGMKDNKLGLRKYLIKGRPAYDLAKPDRFEDFSLPLSPRSPVSISTN
ncbi:MAG: rhamnogalacturonan acetylesterase [Bacteroidales bacterium]|jgi:lysophospholipase L1-like esterase|nr:rhamnogalacturonan acetylesterase [Bacteroidales bacterium]